MPLHLKIVIVPFSCFVIHHRARRRCSRSIPGHPPNTDTTAAAEACPLPPWQHRRPIACNGGNWRATANSGCCPLRCMMRDGRLEGKWWTRLALALAATLAATEMIWARGRLSSSWPGMARGTASQWLCHVNRTGGRIANTLGLIDKVNLMGFDFNLLSRSELIIPNLLPLVIDWQGRRRGGAR